MSINEIIPDPCECSCHFCKRQLECFYSREIIKCEDFDNESDLGTEENPF